MAENVYVSEDTLKTYMVDKLLKINHSGNIDRDKPTIYKVPNSLRQGIPCDYEPELISIGPLHRHKSDELKQMDHLKWKYLQDLIKRSIEINKSEEKGNATHIEKFVKAMWEQEQDVRKQYSVDIGMEPGEFVEVLILDGCFIIELLTRELGQNMGPISLPWGDATWNMPMLRKDLLLLENQIPFSVLTTLFNIAFPQPPPTGDEENPTPPGILDLAISYISRRKTTAKELGKQLDTNHTIHHLLHLNRIYLLQHFDNRTTRNPASDNVLSTCKKITWGSLVNCLFYFVSQILMCKCPRRCDSSRGAQFSSATSSAKSLREGGIKFKRSESKCLLNVSFNKESGELEIPFLSLQQSSISFFRNVIAFELCSEFFDEYNVTAYAYFMDMIVDTAEDVEILVRHGILQHNLGSNANVAKLFTNICKGASFKYKKHYINGLLLKVNEYCASEKHRWRAALENRYFQNPWTVASVIAAVIIVLLTLCATIAAIWQTIYAAKSYEKQFHKGVFGCRNVVKIFSVK